MKDIKRVIKLLEINNELKLLELGFKIHDMNHMESEKYFELKQKNTKIKLLDGEK